MPKRMVSLYELDKSLPRAAGATRKRRRVPVPEPSPPAARRARAFDTGAPLLCAHSAAYSHVVPVPVFEPTDSPVVDLELGSDYSVESFETDDDGTSLELPTLDTIESDEDEEPTDYTAAAASTSSPAGRDRHADAYEPPPPHESRDAFERRMPASFANQMRAVEHDLSELAGRVQPPAATDGPATADNAAAPAPEDDAAAQTPPPAPRVPQGHAVFDEMAQGMRYATEFRLPSVKMSQVFAALDRELDGEAVHERAPGAPVVPRPAPTVSATPTTDDLLQDLDELAPPPAPTIPKGEAYAAAAIDIRHDVQLAPQQTGFSCWAAGAAMLVGWRDQVSIDPAEIARATGYWAQYAAGLHPEDTHVFQVFGLVPEPAQSYTVSGFAELLRRYGPLWVASAEPGPHIRVVTGMVGDGTPAGTQVHINDPWEQGMATFRLPNQGARYTETYQRFVDKQQMLGRQESALQGIYVAHCRPRR
jgi:hypothetical protein